jgi:peptidoglycan/LPS O-acetylase OafA/YrhL
VDEPTAPDQPTAVPRSGEIRAVHRLAPIIAAFQISPRRLPRLLVRPDSGARLVVARASMDPPEYRPDLDGLRAIAVGLVILTHAKWPWTNNGGDAGVTAFFVLSGYLITTILASEQERTGRIDVLAFYRRRVVRLAPALLGLLAFTLVLGVTIGLGNRWPLGIFSCLAYVSNWVQVANINIDPLGHTWSLAIEEQFYLLWPAVLILLRGRVLGIAITGILVASAIRLVATGPFEYFSTITRADAILAGCAIALWRPRWHPAVAVAGVVGLIVVALANPVHDVAIPATMVAAAAVIGGRFESLGVLAPIGLRAYSLYLWNWPMTVLFGSVGMIAPILTVAVGELSYRLLERPALRRGRSEPARVPIQGAPATEPEPEPAYQIG